MSNCGIYLIYNLIDKRVYIGSSKNLKRRLGRHFSELKNNKHKNIHLQRFVNKYKIENLKYLILEDCEEGDLLKNEIFYINEFDSLNKGFNLQPADRHYFLKEHKENMSKAKINSKQNKIINVFKNDKIIFTGMVSEISKNFNLDKSSIYKILKGKRNKHKGLTFHI